MGPYWLRLVLNHLRSITCCRPSNPAMFTSEAFCRSPLPPFSLCDFFVLTQVVFRPCSFGGKESPMELQSIWKKAKEQKRFLAKKLAKITNAVPCKKICECKVWMILKELSIGNIIIALSQINKQKSKLPLVTKMIKKPRKIL